MNAKPLADAYYGICSKIRKVTSIILITAIPFFSTACCRQLIEAPSTKREPTGCIVPPDKGDKDLDEVVVKTKVGENTTATIGISVPQTRPKPLSPSFNNSYVINPLINPYLTTATYPYINPYINPYAIHSNNLGLTADPDGDGIPNYRDLNYLYKLRYRSLTPQELYYLQYYLPQQKTEILNIRDKDKVKR